MELKPGRLYALASVVEKSETFDMGRPMWSIECGAPACLAGHLAVMLNHPYAREGAEGHEWIALLRDELGTSQDDAADLYGGCFSENPIHLITPSEAAQALRNLAHGR